eukprot:4234920-Pleurochrysis_carterae.AAC.2
MKPSKAGKRCKKRPSSMTSRRGCHTVHAESSGPFGGMNTRAVTPRTQKRGRAWRILTSAFTATVSAIACAKRKYRKSGLVTLQRRIFLSALQWANATASGDTFAKIYRSPRKGGHTNAKTESSSTWKAASYFRRAIGAAAKAGV